jgi:hypothetical protein
MSQLERFKRKHLDFEYDGVHFRAVEPHGDEMYETSRDPRADTNIGDALIKLHKGIRLLENGEYRRLALDSELLILPKSVLDVFHDKLLLVERTDRDKQALAALAQMSTFLPNDTPKEVTSWLKTHVMILKERIKAKEDAEEAQNPLAVSSTNEQLGTSSPASHSD